MESNAKQITKSTENHLQKINQNAVQHFQLELSSHTLDIDAGTNESINRNIASIFNSTRLTTESASEENDDNYLESWLINQLSNKSRDYLSLHTKPQAADNSSTKNISRQLTQNENPIEIKNHQRSLHKAWSSFIKKKDEIQKVKENSIQLQKELQDTKQKLQKARENIKEITQSNLLTNNQLTKSNTLLNIKNRELIKSNEKNKILHSQLKKAQEDIEKIKNQANIQSKISTQEAESIKKYKNHTSPQNQPAISQTKPDNHHLQKIKENENLLNKKNSELIIKENEKKQLLTQLHQLQNEFENFYIKHSKNTVHNDKIITPSKKIYFGAEDFVKEQLPYRLGSTMIKNSRSLRGWINMPFALIKTSNNYKKNQKKNINSKPASIQEYSDSNKGEAVKRHLSYRLGIRMLSNSKTLSGWIGMPWALINEVKKFRSKN